MSRLRLPVAGPLMRALLLAALVALVVTPALAQDGLPADTGVQALIDAGLMTVVDQTSEADGVQATVMLAYADTQRIIIRFKLSGDYEPVLRENLVEFLLRDDTARRFSYSMALPVVREDDEVAEVYDVFFYNQTTFELTNGEVEIIDGYLDDYGDSIDLQLDVGFVPTSALGRVLDAAETLEKSPVGPFGFIFTVPIYPPVVVKPLETQTVGDVAVKLERVSVAPSETEIELCYTLPDGRDWQPSIVLDIGGATIPMSGGNLVGLPMPDDTERCVEQRFSGFAGDDLTGLTVIVERLQTAVPDDPEAWEGLVEELATFGIEAEAFAQPGSYFSIEATPTGMTDAELAEIISNARERLRTKLEGPWVFEVALP